MCEMCGRSWDQTWVKPGDSGVGFGSVAYILPVKKEESCFVPAAKTGVARVVNGLSAHWNREERLNAKHDDIRVNQPVNGPCCFDGFCGAFCEHFNTF